MPNMKKVSIGSNCTFCGLCEQEKLADVFFCESADRISVLHNGIFDVDTYPQIEEVAQLCPVKAIKIDAVAEISGVSKSVTVKEYNEFLSTLRNYSFVPPDYSEYGYEIHTYTALPVYAKYRSDDRFHSESAAEDAGFKEFERAVFSQRENMMKQFLTGYRVRRLQQFTSYSESEDNFYYRKKKNLHELLEKAYQLALIATDGELDLKPDFFILKTIPDLTKNQFAADRLNSFESTKFIIDDSRKTGWFHVANYYRTWISVGGFSSFYYDFSEAEAQVRDDIDNELSDIVEDEVKWCVSDLTLPFLKAISVEFMSKVDALQEAVKTYVQMIDEDGFRQDIKDFLSKVNTAGVPEVENIKLDMDTDYNDDKRFLSERGCRKAAESRRERAYHDEEWFVKNLPDKYAEAYLDALSNQLTSWKLEIQKIYGANGYQYPDENVIIKVDQNEYHFSLKDHSDISLPQRGFANNPIYKFAKDKFGAEIDFAFFYGTVCGEKFMRASECEIEIDYDCDYADGFFNRTVEVNKRYGYSLNSIMDFDQAASKISSAFNKSLRELDSVKGFFQAIYRSFSQQIAKISEIKLEGQTAKKEPSNNADIKKGNNREADNQV